MTKNEQYLLSRLPKEDNALLEEPRKKCIACDLWKANALNNANVCLPLIEAKGNTEILVVGDYPFLEDDTAGRPFAGKAGNLFNYLFTTIVQENFKELDLTAEDNVSFTLACKCFPSGGKPPALGQLNSCKELLQYDIIKTNPKVIFAMGELAVKSLTGVKPKNLYAARGDVEYCYIQQADGTYLAFPVIICSNPQNVVKNKLTLDVLGEDIYNGLVYYSSVINAPEKRYILVDTKDMLEEVITKLSTSDIVAFDIETNGVNPFTEEDPKIIGVSFSWGDNEGCFIPVDHPESPWPTTKYIHSQGKVEKNTFIVDALKSFFESSVEKAAHNGLFDTLWLKYVLDISVKNYKYDSAYMSHVLDSSKRFLSLKKEALGLSNIPSYDLELELYLKNNKLSKADMAQIPLDIITLYAVGDADATLQITKAKIKEIEKIPTLKAFYYNFYRHLYPLLLDVELAGFDVNVDYMRELEEKYLQQQEEIIKTIEAFPEVQKYNEQTGKVFNPNSVVMLRELIYGNDYFAQPFPANRQLTAKGQLPVNKDVLIELSRRGSRFAQTIVQYKEITSLLSKVFQSSLRENIAKDNKIHATFNITGTVTGRLSSSNPNMQNIPRKKEIKNIFSAPLGYKLVQADLSQIELRFAGILSGDKTLFDAYKTGKDLHTETATIACQKPEDKITPEERTAAKRINFGTIYLAKEHTIAMHINSSLWEALEEEYKQGKITWEDAQKNYQRGLISVAKTRNMLDQFYKVRHQLYTWQQKQINLITKGHPNYLGYVESLFGRRRYTREETKAVNFPVQSSASDYCLLGVLHLWKWLKKKKLKSKIVGLVHDSVVLLAPDEEVAHVAAKAKHYLEHAPAKAVIESTMPIVADIEVGQTWGNLSRYSC